MVRHVTANDLIFDVGAHQGRDTEFYLRKGFRVVAIEANPILVEDLRNKFRPFISDHKLVILPFGIHEQAGEFDFYRNLDKDDWSSFKPEFGTRDGTKYQVCKIKCVRFDDVLKKYGIPYYLKCDIEGHDSHVLKALLRMRVAPKYLSVESTHLDCLAVLRMLGYSKFKFVNQAKNVQVKCPSPPREGVYVDYPFDGYCSGPFGEESPGDWKSFEAVAYDYLHLYFGFPERCEVGEGWYDFHAKMENDDGSGSWLKPARASRAASPQWRPSAWLRKLLSKC